MPIIRIQALLDERVDVPATIKAIGRAAAEACGEDVKKYWVVMQPLASHHYLEGGRTRDRESAREISPLVTVSVRTGRSREQIALLMQAIARTLAAGLDLADPDLVWVEYREIQPGRLYTGGKIV